MSEELSRLKKVKQRVEALLAKYPYTRNDDVYLILLYWWIYHPEFRKYLKRFIPPDVAKKLTPPESIRRARAYIQNVEHKYLPTDPKVRRKRRQKEETWREAFGKRLL